jgi:hypothetical protein
MLKYWKAIKAMDALGLDSKPLVYYLLELYLDRSFWKYFHKTIDIAVRIANDRRLGGWMAPNLAMILYCLVRYKKPRYLVETGVGAGGTTYFLLNALQRNRNGFLYSIDLPGNDARVYPEMGRVYNTQVPPGFETGWLVPMRLKARWELILGDSAVELPRLVARLPRVDLFLHDSLHTDEHVFFELSIVHPKMQSGSLLLADDVTDYWTLAFVHYCKQQGLPFLVLWNRLGVSLVNSSCD